jgi:hypothetical protein
MAKQQVVFAQERMISGDTIDRSFTTRLNGNYGHLFLTNQKLIFVEEKGFFSKTYGVILDLPYADIAKVHAEERNTNTTITDATGRVYDIAFDPASTLVRCLNELRG